MAYLAGHCRPNAFAPTPHRIGDLRANAYGTTHLAHRDKRCTNAPFTEHAVPSSTHSCGHHHRHRLAICSGHRTLSLRLAHPHYAAAILHDGLGITVGVSSCRVREHCSIASTSCLQNKKTAYE